MLAQLLWRPQAGEGERPGQAKSPAPREDFQLFIVALFRSGVGGVEVGIGVLCPHRNGDPGAGSETTQGRGDAPRSGARLSGGGRGDRPRSPCGLNFNLCPDQTRNKV
jgi:hypothetical protein